MVSLSSWPPSETDMVRMTFFISYILRRHYDRFYITRDTLHSFGHRLFLGLLVQITVNQNQKTPRTDVDVPSHVFLIFFFGCSFFSFLAKISSWS